MTATVDYSSKKVWEDRYRAENDPNTFEWLSGAHSLLSFVQPVTRDERVLHIGCGTSDLAFALSDSEAERILNVDYAESAIARGQARNAAVGAEGLMQWAVVDLLDWESVQRACVQGSERSWSLVLDKSTSDAIACGDYIDVQVPFAPGHPTAELEPLVVLALHLAAIVSPGARWAALSYSATRFDFLEDKLPVHVPGVRSPSDLWTMERKAEAEAFQRIELEASATVHRPPVHNHVYILRRTATPLDVFPHSVA